MDRMKTFGIYALCVIVFYIFSNVMINVAIKATYNPIGADIYSSDNLQIYISDAKATYVNGYVEGNVKNTGEDVEKVYVKIDLYSKRDVLLGTKYAKIQDFRKNETRDFRMTFEFTDVEYCRIELIDNVDESVTEEQFSIKEWRMAKILVTIIFLCYFG